MRHLQAAAVDRRRGAVIAPRIWGGHGLRPGAAQSEARRRDLCGVSPQNHARRGARVARMAHIRSRGGVANGWSALRRLIFLRAKKSSKWSLPLLPPGSARGRPLSASLVRMIGPKNFLHAHSAPRLTVTCSLLSAGARHQEACAGQEGRTGQEGCQEVAEEGGEEGEGQACPQRVQPLHEVRAGQGEEGTCQHSTRLPARASPRSAATTSTERSWLFCGARHG